MLRACVIDFKGSWDDHMPLVEFAYNNSYHASIGMPPYEALYGRKCRSPLCWDEVGERKLLGPELVKETIESVEIIRKRLIAAQDRLKKYADQGRKDRELEVGEYAFLKVSPWKGIMRFGRKGKLSPRFIGPFEILRKVGNVAYELALPPNLQHLHNIFHVSVLRPYKHDYRHVFDFEPIQLKEDLTYEETPVEIIDQKVQVLRTKRIPSVKVTWKNHPPEEATWELEKSMREKHPWLFTRLSNDSGDRIV